VSDTSPQLEHVRAIIADMRRLSLSEAIAVAAAHLDVDEDAWDSSRGASIDASDAAGYGDDWAEEFGDAWRDVAGMPVITRSVHEVTFAIWESFAGAAVAVETRDLIGRHGYTQEDYDRLVGPLVRGLGRRLHPDDPQP